ncbi:MAG: U32 family peptidase [Promethearchaeia archaeon]|nr:MAG: U32 family peptidase [Candidatus Lokiarchaeia archaeon]
MPSKKPELLVPLNGWKTLHNSSTVLDSADAFYFGLQTNFSMRARADNFPIKDLLKLIEMVHDRGKKCYLTTNILIYNTEMVELYQTIQLAHESGVDAIICHDLAAILIAKEVGIPFHVSTQANISNLLSAKFYQELGADRLILARELDLNDIKEIASKLDIPIETFVHGAMCTAVSGRCYLSAELMDFNPDFSANRGKCVQPCRRNYTLEFTGEENEKIDFEPYSGMFFNAKDLCMIGHISELIEAGISSFKVEGRMRDPEYIETTAKCYREAIDSYFNGTYSQKRVDEWLSRLSKVFNRGFHLGFYFSKPGSDDIERTIRGNQAKLRKIQIGKVTNYYPAASAVEVQLFQNHLEIGDTIIFENKNGFYHKQQVKSLQIEGESITNTKKMSTTQPIIVGIKVSKKIPNTAVIYKFIKKTTSKMKKKID